MKTTSFLILIFTLFSCGDENSSRQVGIGGAVQVTDLGFDIPKNSEGNTVEQQNIADRTKVTTDPTKVLWIHLIALDGEIVRRMPVRCKVTSSGKSLEPKNAERDGTERRVNLPTTSDGYYTKELIQPDGTFGSSDAYIYWFDPMGRYHQWGTAGGLGYLLTDYPIDLQDPMDEVTGLYNAHLAAAQWQQEQEEILRRKESS